MRPAALRRAIDEELTLAFVVLGDPGHGISSTHKSRYHRLRNLQM